MPASPEEKQFVAYVLELMQSVGPVIAKRMFGSHGIFLEGLMFGLISNSTLYLKADNDSEQEFKERGLEPFTYQKLGKEQALRYYQAPEEALEHVEEMNIWANKAYGVALRAALKVTAKGARA
ncbi:MAG: TfoX/Sxy family protein [Porticoccaceae bacterium]|nr:TfoX/Sxy family protein [Porticoccaceae bacterium]